MAVTSGAEWRKAREEGFEVSFPSGAVFALRPIEIDFFLTHGNIPDEITPMVLKYINGDSVHFEIPAPEQLEKARNEWIPFLNRLATFALVNPKVVENPQADDEISVDDLSYNDKLFIYAFFAQPARRMRQFREQQTGALALVDNATGNLPAPVRASKRSRVG